MLKHCQNCINFPQSDTVESILPQPDSPILFVVDEPLEPRVLKWFYSLLADIFGTTKANAKETFNISYACSCILNKDNTRTGDLDFNAYRKKVRKSCVKNLFRDIKSLSPKLIVLMGRDSISSMFGGNSKVESKRGRLFEGAVSFKKDRNNLWKAVVDESKQTGITYTFLPTFSPTYVFQNTNTLKMFLNDLVLCHKFVYQQLQKQTVKYELVSNDIDVQEMLTVVNKVGFDSVSCDVETTGLNPLIDKITLLGLTFFNLSADGKDNRYKTYVIDVKKYTSISSKLDYRKEVLAKAVFTNIPSLKNIIGANFKFDIKNLFNYKFPKYPEFYFFDILIAPYLLDNERYGKKESISFEDLLAHYFPADVEFKTIKKKKKKKDCGVNIEDLFYDPLYNAKDAFLTMKIAKILYKELCAKKNERLKRIYDFIYTNLIPMLARMEYVGVQIDCEKLLELKKMYEKKIKAQEKLLKQLIYKGTKDKKFALSCNVGSTDQMKDLFFNRWGLPILKKTKTGKPQLRKDDYAIYEWQIEQGALEVSKTIRKFFVAMKNYKVTTQHYSTFILGIYKNLDSNGRIHTEYRITGTETCRLSSAKINLQNIPRESTDSEIKNLFTVSNPDYVMIEDDLSQIELREMAELSGDKQLRIAYINNRDLHLQTASKCADISYRQAELDYKKDKDSWKDRRFDAKKINFGLQYCMQKYTLAQQLTDYSRGKIVTPDEAQVFIDKFFEIYSGVKDYMDNQIAFVHKHGYVESYFGRRRYLSNINSKNSYIQSTAERQAVNTPIQSTAADIMFTAMILLQQLLIKHNVKARFILTVYDSMVIETKEKEKVKKCIKYVYKNLAKNLEKIFGIKFTIPIDHDYAEGKKWGSLTSKKI